MRSLSSRRKRTTVKSNHSAVVLVLTYYSIQVSIVIQKIIFMLALNQITITTKNKLSIYFQKQQYFE